MQVISQIIFQARIGEAEECIDGMNSKAATTEKLRVRYQMDLQELQNESERINTQAAIAEKKLQTFDKVGVMFGWPDFLDSALLCMVDSVF